MNLLHLEQAIITCKQGGIIAYPTEAVFGLGCLPDCEDAVQRILKLKQRSIKKGLILVASQVKQLESYVDFGKLNDLQKILQSWPGPVTWLIPAREETPDWLTGEHETLAVRVSSHPVVHALCEELGPIVSTSANPGGVTPALSDRTVLAYFDTNIDYVMPAKITNNMNPTEIRDAQTGNIIRPS
jgi:L-threonylcarbamoyladenylate synthase